MRSRQLAVRVDSQLSESTAAEEFATDSYAYQRCGQQCCVFERCTKNDLNSPGELSVTCCCALTYRIRLKATFEVVLGPGLLSLLSGP